jgi:hypothetical protein
MVPLKDKHVRRPQPDEKPHGRSSQRTNRRLESTGEASFVAGVLVVLITFFSSYSF